MGWVVVQEMLQCKRGAEQPMVNKQCSRVRFGARLFLGWCQPITTKPFLTGIHWSSPNSPCASGKSHICYKFSTISTFWKTILLNSHTESCLCKLQRGPFAHHSLRVWSCPGCDFKLPRCVQLCAAGPGMVFQRTTEWLDGLEGTLKTPNSTSHCPRLSKLLPAFPLVSNPGEHSQGSLWTLLFKAHQHKLSWKLLPECSGISEFPSAQLCASQPLESFWVILCKHFQSPDLGNWCFIYLMSPPYTLEQHFAYTSPKTEEGKIIPKVLCNSSFLSI